MSEKNRKNDQKSTIKLAFVVDFWYNGKNIYVPEEIWRNIWSIEKVFWW